MQIIVNHSRFSSSIKTLGDNTVSVNDKNMVFPDQWKQKKKSSWPITEVEITMHSLSVECAAYWGSHDSS